MDVDEEISECRELALDGIPNQLGSGGHRNEKEYAKWQKVQVRWIWLLKLFLGLRRGLEDLSEF